MTRNVLSRHNRLVRFSGFTQGVEPSNFSDSGSVWVHQRFEIAVQFPLSFRKIETLRFGFAPGKNISKPVYKVPVQVRSQKGIILVTQ